MATTHTAIIIFTIMVAVNAEELPGVDWPTAFMGTFESVRCEIKQSVVTADGSNNLDFKLHCLGGIATITYADHMLNAIPVDECTPEHIKAYIRTPELQGGSLPDPSRTELYLVKGNECKTREYNIKDGATLAQTKDTCDDIPKESFTKCTVEPTKWTKTVIDIDSGNMLEQDWPSSMEIVATDPSKLLACSYQTINQKVQLLCLKGPRGYIVYISSENGDKIEKFTVLSCWENDIVSSIFPLKDRTHSSKRPGFWFRTQDGTCYELLWWSEQNLQDPGELTWTDFVCSRQEDPNTIPWLTRTDENGNPVEWVGLWKKCTGPYSIKVYDPQLNA